MMRGGGGVGVIKKFQLLVSLLEEFLICKVGLVKDKEQ